MLEEFVNIQHEQVKCKCKPYELFNKLYSDVSL